MYGESLQRRRSTRFSACRTSTIPFRGNDGGRSARLLATWSALNDLCAGVPSCTPCAGDNGSWLSIAPATFAGYLLVMQHAASRPASPLIRGCKLTRAMVGEMRQEFCVLTFSPLRFLSANEARPKRFEAHGCFHPDDTGPDLH